MSDETWKSSYCFTYQYAAKVMEETLEELSLRFAHSSEPDAEYFDIDEGSFTIKLYYQKYRHRVGFGFPGWLNPGDISDIMISPVDDEKRPKIRQILERFVSKLPKEPWDFDLKVKMYRMGIGSSAKRQWKEWISEGEG
jgi:hypothetical protein